VGLVHTVFPPNSIRYAKMCFVASDLSFSLLINNHLNHTALDQGRCD